MKKISSQVSVAIVCAILGFMLAYQFKVIFKQESLTVNPYNSSDIVNEIEQYKKEKEGLNTKINDLQVKLTEYEESAANTNDTNKSLLKELDQTRLLTGATDVVGPGITIYLIPNSGIFGNGDMKISDQKLVEIVNELKFAGAEAISINDIRITGRTGIRISGDMISINGEDRVSPSKRITIKAIGDKTNLETIFSFPEVMAGFKGICDVKYETSDNIKIEKSNKTFKFEYAKPIKEKQE